MNKLFGRLPEKKILQQILTSEQSAFLAVYGRRRVGKTYLISEFFQKQGRYFELTGIKDAPLSTQLHNFSVELEDCFHESLSQEVPKSWFDAFRQLKQAVDSTSGDDKIILFFDELPWLASPKSNMLQALEHSWNRYLSRNPRVILIICGSAASWMLKHVIYQKGGLHGRLTHEIRLLPFSLQESQEFLKERNIDFEPKQLAELYMCIGGVPKYLTFVKRGFSSAQTIQQLCFAPNAPLRYEFHKLYQSLFKNHELHIRAVKVLAKHHYGLPQEELLKKINLSSGGTSTSILQELQEAGFITMIPEYGKNKKGARYRLFDEYSLFYLSWMESLPTSELKPLSENHWTRQQRSPSWYAWAGYTFENLCFKHIPSIKQALEISGVTTQESCWSIRPTETSPGAQIDLIIDRDDRCLHLCEIKFTENPLELSAKEVNTLRQKKQRFIETFSPRKSVFTTLISSYGAIENKAYHQSIDQQLTLEDILD